MSPLRHIATWVVIIGALCPSATSFAEGAAEPDAPPPISTIQPRRHWLGLDVDAGIETIHLRTFSVDADTLSAGLLPASSTGPTVGVGTGFRFVFLTLGARAQLTAFEEDLSMHAVDSWQLWTFDGEAGVRVPLGRWEPNFALAGGYARLGNVRDAIAGLSKGFDVDGFNIRASGGIDYYVSKHFSIGADVSGRVLALARPGIPARDLVEPKNVGTINEAEARILEGDGSSVGWSVAATALAGVHF